MQVECKFLKSVLIVWVLAVIIIMVHHIKYILGNVNV
jgi:hypothetical protein